MIDRVTGHRASIITVSVHVKKPDKAHTLTDPGFFQREMDFGGWRGADSGRWGRILSGRGGGAFVVNLANF